jgi:hypothetical protein
MDGPPFEDCKGNNEGKKKTKNSKGAKFSILFWSFVDSLFWSLLVQLLTHTHLLAFVVLFKNPSSFWFIVGSYFGPSFLAFVVLFKAYTHFSP